VLNLDYAATLPLNKAAFDAYIQAYNNGAAANPSAPYQAGRKSRGLLEEARGRVADYFDCPPESVIFTASATEANHLAIWGMIPNLPPETTVLSSSIEHPSVLAACQHHPFPNHSHRTICVEKSGALSLPNLRAALSKNAGLLSVMAANNETGVIQPLAEIYAECQGRGIPFHTDAVQAIRFLNPRSQLMKHCDLLALSGHKLGTPRSIGALIVKQSMGSRLQPILRGGKQENQMRAGTENVAAAVSLAVALDEICLGGEAERLRASTARLEQRLRELLPDIYVHGHEAERLPGFLCFSVPGVVGKALVTWLDLQDISVSSGSACSTGDSKASHVLMAMNGDEDLARASIRISMGEALDERTLKHVATTISEGSKHLRRVQGWSEA
jgi:cysteine desulfurase